MRGKELFRTWGPPAAAAGAIFGLSSIPGNRFPAHSEAGSVAVHLGEFFVLGFLLARALRRTWPALPRLGPVAIAVGFCVIYGVADELRQLLVPERVFDLLDVAADSLGAAAGAVVAAFAQGPGRAGRGRG